VPLAIGMLCYAAGSTAQELDPEAADPWAGIEEMVVVGGNAGALLVEKTTSAIAFDAADLQVERISNVADLSNLTPNLEIKSPFAASNAVFFVRGVGLDDFNANSAGAVAIYQDGVYMNSPAGQLFQFFDNDGVDVLRGPQSGRYRNASAAAIRVQSKRPTNEFEAYGNFTTGNYGLVESEGALNIPILQDVLSMRISGKQTLQNGFTKNRCNGKPLLRFNTPIFNTNNRSCTRVFADGFSLGSPQHIKGNENDAENWALRGQLLWDVPLQDGSMEWLLNVHGGRNESRAAQFQHRGFPKSGPDPNDPRFPGVDAVGYADTDSSPFKGDYNNGGSEELDVFGANLRGTWEVSDVHTLVSLSAYEDHTRDTLENSDANPRNLLTSLYRDEAWQFSQDLRLESVWSEELETSIGAYFIMEDLEVANRFELQTFFILDLEYSQDTRSSAIYGELDWEFIPGLTFSATARYTHEYKDFDNFSTAANSAGVSGVGLNVGTANDTFADVSGHVGLNWDVTDDYSVYAKFTRGWKPGHFNGGSVFSGQLIEPVEPEELLAFEIGAKSSLFDGLITIEGAAFYYDFTNLQIFALEQDAGSFPLPQLVNAKGAEIFGAEIQLALEPVEGLRIEYNAGFLETEYTEFTNTLFRVPPRPIGAPPEPPVPVVIDYTGNQMIGAPSWSMSGSIQYTIDLSRFGTVVPRFSFSWKDDTFYDAAEGKGTVQDLPDGTIGQNAHAFLNASLAWNSPEELMFIRGWVKNLTNTEARVQSFDVSDGFDYVFDAYAAPRTAGVTLGFKY
jgi:iron complex outermembrane receptor protein